MSKHFGCRCPPQGYSMGGCSSWRSSVGRLVDALRGASCRCWEMVRGTAEAWQVLAGDISASTPAEMLVSVVIMLIGVIFFGVVIATSQ